MCKKWNKKPSKSTLIIIICAIISIICIFLLVWYCFIRPHQQKPTVEPADTVVVDNGGKGGGGNGIVAIVDGGKGGTATPKGPAGTETKQVGGGKVDGGKGETATPKGTAGTETKRVGGTKVDGGKKVGKSGSGGNTKSQTPPSTSQQTNDKPAPTPAPVPAPKKSFSIFNLNSSQSKLVVVLSIFVILLTFYIIGRVKVSRGEMSITVKVDDFPFDKILIYLAPIVYFVGWCFGVDHKPTQLQIILYTISALLLLGSFAFSIVYNWGNAWHIVISIMAKIFIFVLILIIIFITLVVLLMELFFSHDNDNRGDGDTFIMEYDQYMDRWIGYRV